MKKVKIMLFIVMTILLTLAACGVDKSGKLVATNLNIMTFNIRYGKADDGEDSWIYRKDMVCDVIRQNSPDIIGLQEALRFQIDEIKKQLPQYAEIGEGRDGGEKGEYSAILFRDSRFVVERSGTFWLSDTPKNPSASWGNHYLRICTWASLLEKQSKITFYFFNTHLDHQIQLSREKSAELIAARIGELKQNDPVILSGDFNAGEQNPAISYLKGAGDSLKTLPLHFVDTFRVLHPKENKVGTFNGFKGSTDGDKIDYIFVTPDIQTQKASIERFQKDGHYPSDHFPVTVRIRLQRKSDQY